MAAIGTVDVPVFARFNGEEIEVGTLTFDIQPNFTVAPKEKA